MTAEYQKPSLRKLKRGDKVRCYGETDGFFVCEDNSGDYIVELSNIHQGHDGWNRDNDVPEDYVSIGIDRYMYVSSNNVALIDPEKEDPEKKTVSHSFSHVVAGDSVVTDTLSLSDPGTIRIVSSEERLSPFERGLQEFQRAISND